MTIEFLHIPKNGGMYIRSLFGKDVNPRPHHLSFPSCARTSFAIIRSPFTRLQSIFAHTKQNFLFNHCSNIRLFESLHDIAIHYYNETSTYHQEARNMLSWSREKITSSFQSSIWRPIRRDLIDNDGSLIHFAPQYLFVENDGDKEDPLLLRFEHLDDDLNELIHAGVLPYVSSNKSRKKKNTSKKDNTTRITPLVQRLIHDVYSKDIELFQSLQKMKRTPNPTPSNGYNYTSHTSQPVTTTHMDVLVVCLGATAKKRCIPTIQNIKAYKRGIGQTGIGSITPVPAVTPADFDDSQVHPFALQTIDYSRRSLHCQLSHRNQVGCALSHIECWKRCVEKDEPVLVVEDDLLNPAFHSVLQDFFSSEFTPKNSCDLVSLACLPFGNKWKKNVDSSTFNNLEYMQGCMCYCIHPECARMLLQHALPVVMHIDHYMSMCIKSQSLRAYQHRDASKMEMGVQSTLQHKILIVGSDVPVWALGITTIVLFLLLVCSVSIHCYIKIKSKLE